MPTLYQILQQSNKNGEKINEQFCCGNWKKFDLDTNIKIYTNYQFSSSQIRCLLERKCCQENSKWTGNIEEGRAASKSPH